MTTELSDLDEARYGSRIAQRRVEQARSAVSKLRAQADEITKGPARAMDRAAANIEGIVTTCLNGYGGHWRAADPKRYGDVESAPFEPVHAARAIKAYPKLVLENDPHEMHAQPIELLREVLQKRCAGKVEVPSGSVVKKPRRNGNSGSAGPKIP